MDHQIKTAYLCDHPEHVGTVVDWVYTEWGRYSPSVTKDIVARRMHSYANRNNIPITLVALQGDIIVGTATLRESDLEQRRQLRPWMVSVYVSPNHRNRGIGSTLVVAIETIARRLGYRRIYLYTPDKQTFCDRLEWKALEEVDLNGKLVTIMTKSLPPG